jgi:WD40 repeat protein
MMFSAGWDCAIHGWDLPSFQGVNKVEAQPKITLSGHRAGVVGLVFDSAGQRLISASKDGSIRIFECNNSYNTIVAQISEKPLYSLAIDSSMRHLLTGGADNTLRVWDIGEKKEPHFILSLPTLSTPLHVVKDFPPYRAVIGSGDDNRLKVWTYSQASLFADLSHSYDLVGHRKIIFSFDNHPLKPIIASGGQEKVIFLWDFQTGEPIRKILTQSPISYLKFSPCGDYLLCVCFDNSVRIYNTETGVSCRQFPMHEGHQSTIGLSDDWSLLAVAPFRGKNFAIRLWALRMPKDD